MIGSEPFESAQPGHEKDGGFRHDQPVGWPIGEPSTDPFAVDYHGMHEARP